MNEQNEFCEGRSCLDHIFTLHNILRIRNYSNELTFCAFIDFKKAFNFVDRDFLLYELRNIGISVKFDHAVKALYQNSKSCIQLNIVASKWFDVTNGVRQGDSLSPTLISIHLNDLAEEIKSLNTLRPRQNGSHFADDIFSNAFSWIKMLQLGLKFHWSLFPRVQLTIFQHWFR